MPRRIMSRLNGLEKSIAASTRLRFTTIIRTAEPNCRESPMIPETMLEPLLSLSSFSFSFSFLFYYPSCSWEFLVFLEAYNRAA